MKGYSQNGTEELFSRTGTPLAERVRPRVLDDFVGQSHLLGKSGILRQLIESDRLPSMIFWGGPGTGKTTLARIIAHRTGGELVPISAVSSGVRDVRGVIERAESAMTLGRRTILFIDEIHRFNKAQQDALLHAVEDGTLVLIGATTENPSFEVISPLLSRCKVFSFQPLTKENVADVIDRALVTDRLLVELAVNLEPAARTALIDNSGGDARAALNGLETAVELARSESDSASVHLTVQLVEKALQTRPGRYDKGGDFHYDVISAFIKSLRGSDPDGAVYWLARMIDAGEDPRFIVRRMVILASEDIGNANPTALVLAQACADAVHFVGMPEAQLMMAQTALYLASSPKSNATLRALMDALEDVKDQPERAVPLHLRNAPTGLMKSLGYGTDYKYAHDFPDGFVKQQFLPDGLEDRVYYQPSSQGSEQSIAERLKRWRPDRYNRSASREERKNKDDSR